MHLGLFGYIATELFSENPNQKQEEPFKGQEESLPHDAGKEESVANQGKEVKKGPNSTHGFGLDSMLKCNVPSFVNC